MPLVVTVNQNQLRDIISTLRGIRNGSDRAMFTAVNRTSRTAKTRLGMLVSSELNIKALDARRRVFVIRKPTKENPIAGIRISGKLPSLSRFGAVQLKGEGVMATTFKSEGRKRFTAAFKGSFKKGKRIVPHPRLYGHVFSRQGQRDNRQIGPISDRYKIHKLLGPSAADAVERQRGRFNSTINDIEAVLEKNLLSQVDRLLSRRKVDR